MNSDNPNWQISLNLVAICVFGMTLSSLVAPLVHIPSTIPILTMFGIMAIATIDGLLLKSIAATIVIDAIAQTDPEYRQRIIHHEAGHFLVAHLLGIPIIGYHLSAWEAIRQGQSAQGGVMFAPPPPEVSTQLLQQYYTVWMAGIAAEKLVYDRSIGGSEDRQKLRGIMVVTGQKQPEIVRQENSAILQARTLIHTHWTAYQALVVAMGEGATVSDCCNAIAAVKVV